MRKFICIFLVTACALSAAAQNDPKKHSIDGDASDWTDSLFHSEAGAPLSFATDNDGQFVYVAVKITDPRDQMRLSHTGLKILIDPRGKDRDNNMWIAFPTPKAGFPSGNRGGDPSAPPAMSDVQQQVSSSMMMYRTYGFDGQDGEQSVLLSLAPGDIRLAAGWNSANALVIEYAIPVEKLGGIGRLAGKTASIGVKTTAGEPRGEESSSMVPDAPSMPAGGGRGGGGGGGGRSGNGRKPTFDRTSQTEMNSHFSPGQTYWTKYTFVK